MHDKKECVIHMPNLRQALNHGLVLRKLNRVIKFNQETWQRKNLKNEVIFGKAMEIARNHRNIKCATN